jgi:hypothetical protein
MRTSVNRQTTEIIASHNSTNACARASVPAVSAWNVAVKISTKLAR